MAAIDLATVAFFLGSIIGIFLLGMTWFYIDKLEKIGCKCSEHPYRAFIKNYAIFAIVYLLVTLFFPPAIVAKNLGMAGGIGYTVLNILFSIATLVFFILAIIYVQYLMKEKCLCSVDVRREVLYYWSILEVIILLSMLLLTLFVPIIVNTVGLVTKTGQELADVSGTIREAVMNPVSATMKFPKNIKKIAKSLSSRK